MSTKKDLKTATKKALIETAKFGARMFLLIVVPVLIDQLANLQGTTGEIVGKILPIALPLIDKFIHDNSNIDSNGISPF